MPARRQVSCRSPHVSREPLLVSTHPFGVLRRAGLVIVKPCAQAELSCTLPGGEGVVQFLAGALEGLILAVACPRVRIEGAHLVISRRAASMRSTASTNDSQPLRVTFSM